MPSLHTDCLTGIFLTLDMEYFFMAVPAKCSCCSLPCMWSISSQPPPLTWDMEYLLTAAAPRSPGVLSRGGKKHHLFFRKISLATGWRRKFGASRGPVRRLGRTPQEAQWLTPAKLERFKCCLYGRGDSVGVGEKRNKGALHFYFT